MAAEKPLKLQDLPNELLDAIWKFVLEDEPPVHFAKLSQQSRGLMSLMPQGVGQPRVSYNLKQNLIRNERGVLMAAQLPEVVLSGLCVTSRRAALAHINNRASQEPHDNEALNIVPTRFEARRDLVVLSPRLAYGGPVPIWAQSVSFAPQPHFLGIQYKPSGFDFKRMIYIRDLFMIFKNVQVFYLVIEPDVLATLNGTWTRVTKSMIEELQNGREKNQIEVNHAFYIGDRIYKPIPVEELATYGELEDTVDMFWDYWGFDLTEGKEEGIPRFDFMTWHKREGA